jgi:hypothetical protein
MYPQNKQEADKFAAGLIKSLHSDQTRDANMKILTDNRVPVAARLATLVSNIMTAMLARINKQAGGRKPHIRMLVDAIKMLIIEASRMALIAGVEVTEDDKRKAAKIAGDMLEAGNSPQQGPQGGAPMQPQPQAQPMQPQQQGWIGGQMQ